LKVKQEIPFFVPWITEEDKKAVLEVLASRWLTGGPKAKEFEKLFASYTSAKYSISVKRARLGALYKGKNAGTFGAVGCFSFYPTKIITTIEGGMATTQDEEIANKMLILKEHGMTKAAFARENKARAPTGTTMWWILATITE
jgi:dTDP-4-amino-4,6-dideoxygalactose transaminase